MRVEPAAFTPVYYKLETLDRRERMGSVRKRRKAEKEATTNLKLRADSNERQLAQRSVVVYVQQTLTLPEHELRT